MQEHTGESGASYPVGILVESFMDDPFFVWVTADEEARMVLLQATFTMAVNAVSARGFLHADSRGVAVLIPPGEELYDAEQAAAANALLRKAFQHPLSLLDDYQQRLRAAFPTAAVDAWYLQYLAVPVAIRSSGHGASMMREVLAKVGHEVLWLHSGRPDNLSFYDRFGLKICSETPCEQNGPIIYTLLGRAGLRRNVVGREPPPPPADEGGRPRSSPRP